LHLPRTAWAHWTNFALDFFVFPCRSIFFCWQCWDKDLGSSLLFGAQGQKLVPEFPNEVLGSLPSMKLTTKKELVAMFSQADPHLQRTVLQI